jgi:hypothetical protein
MLPVSLREFGDGISGGGLVGILQTHVSEARHGAPRFYMSDAFAEDEASCKKCGGSSATALRAFARNDKVVSLDGKRAGTGEISEFTNEDNGE